MSWWAKLYLSSLSALFGKLLNYSSALAAHGSWAALSGSSHQADAQNRTIAIPGCDACPLHFFPFLTSLLSLSLVSKRQACKWNEQVPQHGGGLAPQWGRGELPVGAGATLWQQGATTGKGTTMMTSCPLPPHLQWDGRFFLFVVLLSK